MEKSLSENNTPVVHLRLIPVTREIKLAMMDFNSPSLENEENTTKSLNELVKEEIDDSLRSLKSNIENCVKKEELPEIINQCIQDNLTLCPSAHQLSSLTPLATSSFASNEVQDESESNDDDVLMKENIIKLEKRINFLESKLSSVFQLIPNLKIIPPNFKIDPAPIKFDKSIDAGQLLSSTSDKTTQDGGNCDFENMSSSEKDEVNPYDEMYYEWRQNKMNLLHYKHSECSLELNKKLVMESSHGVLPNYTLPAAMSKSQVKARFINSQHLLI
ncbi:uncharacterized protein LOC129941016 [Eupeodes corollae]|uniref:uncharacterized protein LOC129941016 n=1 Tax=Eupeodes corollae TaxID=290404 RepID=UPI0024926650|nr:uncharacterized protein LOC129941016 [Eupeodes corollae]